MCRIVGFWDFARKAGYDTEATILAMRDTMAYGGPDDAGVYTSTLHRVALGHRRLSVLDLSPAGHQPMRSGSLVITYNGEIYNFREIGQELASLGHRLTSHSDTEVVLKAFEQWGLDAVQRFRGMFAFAIWDEEQEKIILCRDRVGVKPLYWYLRDGLFMFASELKAFHRHPGFAAEIDFDAVSLFLQLGYIPAPRAIFQHTQKLEPASFLVIDRNQQVERLVYWGMDAAAREGGWPDSEKQAVETLEEVLMESFRLRLVSDVPVGIFLSGGIDSSLVTTLLQKDRGEPVRTFTIGFESAAHNEAVHAARLARYLGTDHTELYCTERDFQEVLPELPCLYDEPFGDSSAIPTFLLAQLARHEVTVSLSADGGDEVFGGYAKYEATRNLFPRIRRIPRPLRRLAQGAVAGVDPAAIEKIAGWIPFLRGFRNLKDKTYKFINAMDADEALDFFIRASSYMPYAEVRALLADRGIPVPAVVHSANEGRFLSLLGATDLMSYLPDDLMVKVDRATMAVALEGREPLLDHRVIEFGLRLPDHMKLRNGQSKWILRQILNKHVPAELIERPKQGFEIPIYQWLKGLLSEELRAMAQDRSFIDCFGFDSSRLTGYVRSFLSGKRFVNAHFLWFLYMLYLWYHTWVDRS